MLLLALVVPSMQPIVCIELPGQSRSGSSAPAPEIVQLNLDNRRLEPVSVCSTARESHFRLCQSLLLTRICIVRPSGGPILAYQASWDTPHAAGFQKDMSKYSEMALFMLL
jgi:hypothetical protein